VQLTEDAKRNFLRAVDNTGVKSRGRGVAKRRGRCLAPVGLAVGSNSGLLVMRGLLVCVASAKRGEGRGGEGRGEGRGGERWGEVDKEPPDASAEHKKREKDIPDFAPVWLLPQARIEFVVALVFAPRVFLGVLRFFSNPRA